MRRHRRGQDRPPRARRDPDLRARTRRIGGGQPRTAALLDRARACARARSPAARRGGHAADLFRGRRSVRRQRGGRCDAALGPSRARDEVDRAGRHRRRDPAALSGARQGPDSRTCRARSSSRRARRSTTSGIPTGSSSATTATGPETRSTELYSPLGRAARAHRRRERRDDQARRERVSRHQDLVHQRDRQRVRGDRRRRSRGGPRHGPRPADRDALPQAGYRIRRRVAFPKMFRR